MMARRSVLSVLLAAMVAAGCDDDPVAVELDAPAGVTAAATSPNMVTVSWSAVAGADSYVVERATGAAGGALTYAQVGTSSATSYADAGVQPETTYQYRVA